MGLLVGGGLALARASAKGWRVTVKWAPWMLGSSLVGLAFVRSALGNTWPADDLYARACHFTLLASLCGALLVLCVRSDECRKTPVLGNRVVRHIGALGYGIYVYHFLLVGLLAKPLRALFGRGVLGFVAMLLGIALVSYAPAALPLHRRPGVAAQALISEAGAAGGP